MRTSRRGWVGMGDWLNKHWRVSVFQSLSFSHLRRSEQVLLAVRNIAQGLLEGLWQRDISDAGLIPGLGRSPGGGHGNRSGILAWRISWTEEPSRLYSPQSCKELDMTEATWHAHGPQRPSLTHHFVNQDFILRE